MASGQLGTISSPGLIERRGGHDGFGGAGWKGWFRGCWAVWAGNGAIGTLGRGGAAPTEHFRTLPDTAGYRSARLTGWPTRTTSVTQTQPCRSTTGSGGLAATGLSTGSTLPLGSVAV